MVQTMMFSATLNDETRGVCKRFMVDPLEVIVEVIMALKSFFNEDHGWVSHLRTIARRENGSIC